MIEVEGLTVRFAGVTPIDGVSVVFPGGTCGLIGPNGAGKTTFFNVLSGFVKPAEGSIRAFGDDLLKMVDYRRARWGLRRTFQTEMAIEQLSVFDNIAMIHEHSGAGRATRRADVLSAIEYVGLEVLPEVKVGGLGARDRRLVEIARAVVGAPKVVLLDEPAAGLPDEETEHLAGVIQGIPERFGALVILVDHDMSLVQACCTTTAVLDFGRLIATGPTAEVLRDENVMRAYLGTEDVEGTEERRGHGGRPVSRRPSHGPELRFEELCVARGGRRVLHDVSLAIPPGEITTLLGPNGAGKSSLVLAVGGVLRVDSGRVLLGDADLTRQRPEFSPRRRRRDRARGQAPAAGAHGRGQPPRRHLRAHARRTRRAGIARALELFPELEKRWKITCRSLSGGEQQMVVLAQALVSHPRVILVDELSLGLAPVVVKRLAPVAPGDRRLRRRHPADRAVRAHRARPREQGLRARGRPHPLRGHGQGAHGAARSAALRLPPARQGRRARARLRPLDGASLETP